MQGLYYANILADYITGVYVGSMLQSRITESYYGIRSWNHVTECPYVDRLTAPEAVDCCIRILSLQRIIPRTALDHFGMYNTRTDLCLDSRKQHVIYA